MLPNQARSESSFCGVAGRARLSRSDLLHAFNKLNICNMHTTSNSINNKQNIQTKEVTISAARSLIIIPRRHFLLPLLLPHSASTPSSINIKIIVVFLVFHRDRQVPDEILLVFSIKQLFTNLLLNLCSCNTLRNPFHILCS